MDELVFQCLESLFQFGRKRVGRGFPLGGDKHLWIEGWVLFKGLAEVTRKPAVPIKFVDVVNHQVFGCSVLRSRDEL